MDIKRKISRFEGDPSFFLRHRPELHAPLLEIAKSREPDDWIEGMPTWLVPERIIGDAIAACPHGLLFISDAVDRSQWIKIANHEKLEAKLVANGYSPEEAHELARRAEQDGGMAQIEIGGS